MGEPIVDVRDMLCAQALALVAQTVSGPAPRQAVQIRYNSEDVRRDLAAWARERGHTLTQLAPFLLQVQRRAQEEERDGCHTS